MSVDLDRLRDLVVSRAGQSDLACVPVLLGQLRALLREVADREGVWLAVVELVEDAELMTKDGPALVSGDRWRALVEAVDAVRGAAR